MADEKETSPKEESTGADKATSVKEAPKQAEKKPEAPAKKDESKAAAPAEKQVSGSTVETKGSIKEEPPKEAPAAVAKEEVAAPMPAAVPTLQTNDADASVLEMFRHRLDEYCVAVAPGKAIDPNIGAKWQRTLMNTIDQILKLEGTVFFKAWADLLAKAQAERTGVFSEKHALRWTDRMKLEPAQLRQFQSLVNLIIHTAEPKGRQQMLKMIDISKVTANLKIAGAADRLYEFYHL